MHVRHLTLAGFRSYALLEVDLPAGPQVVVGPNAAGKTNLLEALALLSRGARTARVGRRAGALGEPVARAWRA